MDIINKFLPIVLSILMSVNLSGCGSEEPKAQKVDGVYAATTESTDLEKAETAESTEKKKSEKTDESVYDDVNLPPDMTFDDLHNMIKLNGQTVSLPATFNELLAIDDNFTYEWSNAEKQFKTPEDQLDSGLGVTFDLLYNDVFITSVIIQPWTYNGNLLDSKVISRFSFSKTDCDKAGLDVTFADDLHFGSTKDEMIAVFGDNIYEEREFKNNVNGMDIVLNRYFFYEGERELYITICFSKDDMKVVKMSYGC